MKRFKFQFETLEKVRQARENEAMRVLSEAQSRLSACIREKETLMTGLDQALSRRERIGTATENFPSIGVMPLQLEDTFIEGQKHRMRRQDQLIMRARRLVDKAMQAYLVARRGTRMIERLRENAVEAHRLAFKRWEQGQLDDLMVMRARLKDDEFSLEVPTPETKKESA